MSTCRQVFSCHICATVWSRSNGYWSDNCPKCGAHPNGFSEVLYDEDEKIRNRNNSSDSSLSTLFGYLFWAALAIIIFT